MTELRTLKEFAPKEAPIYFLMGKVARKLKKNEDAMVHFTTALDLDAKNANYIKTVIDKLHMPSEPDDEDIDDEPDLG